MRMQLHLQHFQLRLSKLRLKLASAEFALAESAVVVDRLVNAKDRPVDEQVLVKSREGVDFEDGHRMQRLRCVGPQRLVDQHGRDCFQKGKEKAGGNVNVQALSP